MSCLPVINLLNVEGIKELNISDPPCSQGESCVIDLVLEPRADEVAQWVACGPGLGSLGPL